MEAPTEDLAWFCKACAGQTDSGLFGFLLNSIKAILLQYNMPKVYGTTNFAYMTPRMTNIIIFFNWL